MPRTHTTESTVHHLEGAGAFLLLGDNYDVCPCCLIWSKLVMLKVKKRRGKSMRTKKVVQATITAITGRVQRG